MLRFDIRAAVLAGLISREKNYPSSFFRIAFEHGLATLSQELRFNPKRLRQNLSRSLYCASARRKLATLQDKNTIRAPRQRHIMSRENGSEPMGLVEFLHQVEDRCRAPFIQVSGRLVC